eukprot:scaffold169118_cov45-Prasinocladus_malaysianus.AAC.1
MEFEERAELPFSGQPSSQQLLYFTMIQLCIWGIRAIVMNPSDVKGTAWGYAAIFVGHLVPRLTKLVCLSQQHHSLSEEWAMFELSCVIFAVAYFIIIIGRIHAEELNVKQYWKYRNSKNT